MTDQTNGGEPKKESLFQDEHGNPRLPIPTTTISFADPYAVVMDMTVPGPDGRPVQRKLLRYMDRTNPMFAVDILVDEETASKLAEQMGKRHSGIVPAPASALKKLPGLPR